MPGIGVISNPNARFNRMYPGLKDRLSFIVGWGGDVASTGTLEDVESTAQAFKDCEIDMVAISGGDGTAQRTLEKLLKVYGDTPLPPVLLLPTGTMNMVPASFGIHGKSLTVLLRIVARYRHNLPIRCIRRNLLKVNDHYSFMFGVGVPARFLQVYNQGNISPLDGAKLLGSYVWDAIKGGSEKLTDLFRTVSMTYCIDEGIPHEVTLNAMFVSFIEEVALKFRICPRAGQDRNVFEILRLSGGTRNVGFSLPWLWMGSLRKLNGIDRDLARKLTMTLQEPEPYTLDGEVYAPESQFEITAGPELRFVVPGHPKGDRTEEMGPFGLQYMV